MLTDFQTATKLTFTHDPKMIRSADFIIIAVPTPVDDSNHPDLSCLETASATVGSHMKSQVIVIYESTVYPGATEEVCIPILEQYSKMQWLKDFYVGYAPERINPNDPEHGLTKIIKVISADTQNTLPKIAQLYALIIPAGIYCAPNIKTAEAAKVIENTQRDLNIALMNELAMLFEQLGLNTMDVLKTAETKWNFCPFKPGLVGGHCIGVDPFYLTFKANKIGFHPQLILAGRRINDSMAKYIAEQTVKQITNAGLTIYGAKINILGFTFKENCPDTRNTQIIILTNELKSYGAKIYIHDPLADANACKAMHNVELLNWEQLPQADAIILAVSHKQFLERKLTDYQKIIIKNGCFIDVKSVMNKKTLKNLGLNVWQL